MQYQTFLQEWQGRRIDFDHSGIYLAEDLIREYAFSFYKVGIAIPKSPTRLAEIWHTQPEGMSDYYYQSNDMVLREGDLVLLNDFEHIVIANGEQTPERFECLEQNAVGSKTGVGDDAIRENWYDKSAINGIYRARYAAGAVIETVEPEPLAEVEPVTPEPVAKPYKHPTGALRVPMNRVAFRIVKEIPGYDYMSFAQEGKSPVDKLYPGKYYMLLQTNGMAKIDSGEGTRSYWINPADNTLQQVLRPAQVEYKPELDAAKEAEENYVDFTDQNGKLSEKYYTARASGAFVIDFATGNTRTMPQGAHVWLSGITQVGTMGYGIATKCIELDPIRWVGISLGQLYEDDTFNKQTTLEERQALRTLKPKDYLILVKAKTQKKFMDIRKV